MNLIKVNVFLKSGQTVMFKCKRAVFHYDNDTLEFTGYQYEDLEGLQRVSFVPSQIAAYTVEEVGY